MLKSGWTLHSQVYTCTINTESQVNGEKKIGGEQRKSAMFENPPENCGSGWNQVKKGQVDWKRVELVCCWSPELSSGFLLSGSFSIVEPCHQNPIRLHRCFRQRQLLPHWRVFTDRASQEFFHFTFQPDYCIGGLKAPQLSTTSIQLEIWTTSKTEKNCL